MRVRPPLEPLLAASQKGLKEWAVVCRALESGRQTVLLRKGGIIEETRDFALVERRFCLFPTYEHQDAESVRDDVRELYAQSLVDQPPAGTVRISSWADVAAVHLCHDLDAILSLRDAHVWTDDYVRKRMAYKPRKPMTVVVLRVMRLPEPMLIPDLERYEGCKSWVPLETTVPPDASEPVLADAELEASLRTIGDAVGAE